MAVTFEADGAYTGALADWPEYKSFLRSALEWIKRPAGEAELDAQLTLEGRSAVVRVELPEAHHVSAAPEAWLLAQAGAEPRPLQLAWVGPNALSARVPVDSAQAYQAVIAWGDRMLTLP